MSDPEGGVDDADMRAVIFIIRCVDIALFTAVAYDYVLTVHREVHLVWRTRLTTGTAIYVLNRYCLIAVYLLTVVGDFTRETTQRCYTKLVIGTVLEMVMFTSQAVFVCLRLFAIWAHSWLVSGLLLASYAVLIIMNLIIGGTSLHLAKHDSFAPICWIYLPSESNSASLELSKTVIVLILDIASLLLTWAKTYDIWRQAVSFNVRAPVSVLLLRDGTIHFVILFTLSIADIVFVPSVFGIATMIGAGLSIARSITISHFIFHLRAVYLDKTDDGNRLQDSLVRFASSISGNLGAPLDFAPGGGDSVDSLQSDGAGDIDESSASSSAVSHNPLAHGILPYTRVGGEDGEALLAGSCRESAVREVKIRDVFDDVTYGARLIGTMHRGDSAINVTDPAPTDPETQSFMSHELLDEVEAGVMLLPRDIIAYHSAPTNDSCRF